MDPTQVTMPAGSALQSLVAEEAAWLRGLGVRRAGLLAANGPAWIVADLAAAAADLVQVPLPQAFTRTQLQHAVNTTGLDTIVCDAAGVISQLDSAFKPVALSPRTGLTVWQRELPGAPPLPAGTVKVSFTSGSTAAPRGVCLTAATLEAVAAAVGGVVQRLGLQRHLALLPLATLLENLAGVGAAIRAGIQCVVPDAAATGVTAGAVHPARLLAALDRWQPESVILVPELLRVLVAACRAGWVPPPSLRFMAVGGARVPASLLAVARGCGLPCFQGYGLSECASVVALNLPGDERDGSVGRPLPHLRVRVDTAGEIHVAGPVMAGYAGDTRVVRGEIATGDLGHLDADGFLYVHGRRDNVMVTSFGRNLSPEWIEAELLAEGIVGQAVAFGDGRPYVGALLRPARADIATADLESAVARANARLPAYARVQRWALAPVDFTPASGLLTGNGRPRRPAIARRFGPLIDTLYTEVAAS